MSELY